MPIDACHCQMIRPVVVQLSGESACRRLPLQLIRPVNFQLSGESNCCRQSLTQSQTTACERVWGIAKKTWLPSDSIHSSGPNAACASRVVAVARTMGLFPHCG